MAFEATASFLSEIRIIFNVVCGWYKQTNLTKYQKKSEMEREKLRLKF